MMLGPILNRLSNNLIDWNRVGELLRSGRHRYSTHEIVVRTGIVVSTLMGTYLGTRLLKRFNMNCWLAYLSSFLLSFSVSHAIAISPLVKKRLDMRSDIDVLILEIRELCYPGLSENIEDLITRICKLEAKNNASSATLGRNSSMMVLANFFSLMWRSMGSITLLSCSA